MITTQLTKYFHEASNETIITDTSHPLGNFTWKMIANNVITYQKWIKVLCDNSKSKEKVIIIWGHCSIETIVAQIAVIFSGCTFQLIDKSSPISWLEETMSITKPIGILYHPDILFKNQLTVTIPCKEISINSSTNSSCDYLNLKAVSVTPDFGFHITFTTGTTGTPKAIFVEINQVEHFLIESKNSEWNYSSNDISIPTAGIQFDIHIQEIWSALYNNSKLVIIPKNLIMDSKLLSDKIKEYNITSIFMIPKIFEIHCTSKFSTQIFSNLSQILIGGDIVPFEHSINIALKYPSLKVVSAYGPAECTFWILYHRIQPFNDNNIYDNKIPLGSTCINGSTASILDKDENIYSVHSLFKSNHSLCGELILMGKCITRGYINSLNINSNFSTLPDGTKIYKTGDIVHINANSQYIYFNGRQSTNFIKINGCRVSVIEIETKIRRICNRDVYITHYKQNNISKLMCIIPNSHEIEIRIIEQLCKDNLPNHMVPFRFESISNIITNSNGKIDKNRMLQTIFNNTKSTNICDNKLITTISNIWYNYTGVKIHQDSKLLEYTPDSLIIYRFIDTINSTYPESNFIFSMISKYPSIYSIAKYIENIKLTNSLPEKTILYNNIPNVSESLINISNIYKSSYLMQYYIPLSNYLYSNNVQLKIKNLFTNFNLSHIKVIIDKIPYRLWNNKIQNFMDCDINRGISFNDSPIRISFLLNKEGKVNSLIWIIHHALFDGISITIILKSFLDIYYSKKNINTLNNTYAYNSLQFVPKQYNTNIFSYFNKISLIESKNIKNIFQESNWNNFHEVILKENYIDNLNPSIAYCAWILVLYQQFGISYSQFVFSGRSNKFNNDLGCFAKALPIIFDINNYTWMNTNKVIENISNYLYSIEEYSAILDPLEITTKIGSKIPFCFNYGKIEEEFVKHNITSRDRTHFPLAFSIEVSDNKNISNTIRIHSTIKNLNLENIYKHWRFCINQINQISLFSQITYPMKISNQFEYNVTSLYLLGDNSASKSYVNSILKRSRIHNYSDYLIFRNKSSKNNIINRYKISLLPDILYKDFINVISILLLKYTNIKGYSDKCISLLQPQNPFNINNLIGFKILELSRNDRKGYNCKYFPQKNSTLGIISNLPDEMSAVIWNEEKFIIPSDYNISTQELSCINFIYKNKSTIEIITIGNEQNTSFPILFSIEGLKQVSKHIKYIISQKNKPYNNIKLSPVNNTSNSISNSLSNSLEFSTIPELFQNICKDYPNNIAITDTNRNINITYAEVQILVKKAINALVNLLNSIKDYCKQPIIAVSLNRSIDMYVLQLAIMHTKAVLLPMDPLVTAKRQYDIISKAKPVVIIGLLNSNYLYNNCIIINNYSELINKYTTTITKEYRIPVSSDLCYCIFTSGSTGTPKGVCVEHKNIVSMFMNQTGFHYEVGDISLPTASVQFDMSLLEGLGSICNGSTVVIVDTVSITDSRKFQDIIKNYKITKIIMVATVFHLHARENPTCFQDIIQVAVGGDIVIMSLVDNVHKHCPNTCILPGWGPTETTMASTYVDIRLPYGLDIAPIGVPVDGETVTLVDLDYNEVAYGLPGEIVMSGSGVARGYFENNSKGFSKLNNIKSYFTGDIGVWRDDLLYFLSRGGDQQVKIRGNRVELAEISTALLKISYIQQAIAIANQRDSSGERILVGYIVLDKEISITKNIEQRIRKELENIVPHYMIPKYIKIIEDIPMTTNQKIDKCKLPKIKLEDSEVHQIITKDINALDRVCNSILQRDINYSEHSNDDWNYLGIDSIDKQQLFQYVKTAYGLESTPTVHFINKCKSYNSLKIELGNLLDNFIQNNANSDVSLRNSSSKFPIIPSCDIETDIVVVSMECILPNCDNVNELYTNFTNNTCLYNSNSYLTDKQWLHQKSIGISSAILLDTIKRALKTTKIHSNSTGIFIAASDIPNESNDISDELKNSADFIPMHIMNKLYCSGPCQIVKTACSSGISAFHQGCNNLRLNQCDIAIIGGLYLRKYRENKSSELSNNGNKIEGDSISGTHHPFDFKGDGGVQNDTCSVIVLKRLSTAIEDNDNIISYITSSNVINSGIETDTISDISQNSIKESLQKSLQFHYLQQQTVPYYYELPGTGLPFVDEIQMKILGDVVKKYSKSDIYIDSSSGICGNTEIASGLLNIIRGLLVISKKKKFSLTNCNNPITISTNIKIPKQSKSEIHSIGILSYGLGGTASSVFLLSPDSLKK